MRCVALTNVAERTQMEYNKWAANNQDEEIIEIVNDPGILAHTELGKGCCKIRYACILRRY